MIKNKRESMDGYMYKQNKPMSTNIYKTLKKIRKEKYRYKSKPKEYLVGVLMLTSHQLNYASPDIH